MINSRNIDLRSRRGFLNSKSNTVNDTLPHTEDSSEIQMTISSMIKKNTKFYFDNTSFCKMSSQHSKRTPSNRRSLSESSAEDLCQEAHTGNGVKSMWRNELLLDSKSHIPQPVDKSCFNTNAYSRQTISDVIDVILRIIIVVLFFKLEFIAAFQREIHAEELWLYQNPRRPDIVSPAELMIAVIVGPFIVTYIIYLFTKDKEDFRAANWAWTLGLCLNGIPTSLLKLTVGRPRPDFFYRCFPDGAMVVNTNSSTYLDFNCTGRFSDINEGRKSFPSGHSSFAFASFGFISYYIGSKLHAFDARGRGHTWRLCIALIPFFVASLVAVSRTCDYHHHWQDITVGALIGIIAGYVSYIQYYPSIFSEDSHRPLSRWPKRKQYCYQRIGPRFDGGGDTGDTQPLLDKNLN